MPGCRAHNRTTATTAPAAAGKDKAKAKPLRFVYTSGAMGGARPEQEAADVGGISC